MKAQLDKNLQRGLKDFYDFNIRKSKIPKEEMYAEEKESDFSESFYGPVYSNENHSFVDSCDDEYVVNLNIPKDGEVYEPIAQMDGDDIHSLNDKIRWYIL